ncbi:hypothetical protein, partial [Streptomyces sp. NPDC005877]|uniref:hypothetical protein n=1 Tax=Streptomyces sp. NPDC005877 TaxID=3155346 RepID=UPI0033C5CB0E
MPLLTATFTTQESGDDMLNSQQHVGRVWAGARAARTAPRGGAAHTPNKVRASCRIHNAQGGGA